SSRAEELMHRERTVRRRRLTRRTLSTTFPAADSGRSNSNHSDGPKILCPQPRSFLLSRGGESRRGSGGWGGAGQQNHSLDQHHPVCAGQGGFATFSLPRSHPSSSEEGKRLHSRVKIRSSET